MPFTERDSKKEKQRLKELVENSEEARQAYEEFNTFYEFRMSLIKARKESKITQKQLSDKTGLSQQYISRIETDNNNVTLETLFKYLKGIKHKIIVIPDE